MKRSEWLKVGDIITEDLRNGESLRVVKVKEGNILVEEITPTRFYIDDEENKQYFKISNVNEEYATQHSELA